MNRRGAALMLAGACAWAPLAAYAQATEPLTYRCVGADRKTYYGQTMPPQCAGQPLEMLNRQGLVVKRIDPKADAEEKARKQADDAKKKAEEAALKEQRRREKALLATYASEGDIDLARNRALADNAKAVKDIESRIESAKKRQAAVAKEMEFYQGKNKPPAKLAQDAENAANDVKALDEQRARKAKEVESINARYDEDKRRYIELTRGSAPAKSK